jgi:epoxyqueuosine reductase QueG
VIIETIRNILTPPEDFISGIADVKGLLQGKFDRYPYGISIGKRLNDNIVDDIINGPTLEYYQHYKQTNRELSALAHQIASELHKIHVDAMVIEPTVDTESAEFENHLKTLTVDVSHKMVATRAGLGWIGKADLFISKTLGPRVRLTSILIDRRPATESVPVERSLCGNCRVCVEKCPAGAANGKSWNIHVHRDLFFDAHKCREMCGKLAKQQLNVNIRICGICVAVCPVGSKTKNSKFIR